MGPSYLVGLSCLLGPSYQVGLSYHLGPSCQEDLSCLMDLSCLEGLSFLVLVQGLIGRVQKDPDYLVLTPSMVVAAGCLPVVLAPLDQRVCARCPAIFKKIILFDKRSGQIQLMCLYPCCNPIQITGWFVWEDTIVQPPTWVIIMIWIGCQWGWIPRGRGGGYSPIWAI